MKKFVISPLALALTLGAPAAMADAYGDAVAAYNRGDYQAELTLLRPLAEAGDPAAQYNVAVMYATGQGVLEDNAEALKWYRLSAGQGFVKAQNNLGVMYSYGNGVERNSAEGLEWLEMAAKQGYAEAQFNLGALYSNGEGIPQNYVKAYLWLSLAASAAASDKATEVRDAIVSQMTAAQLAEAQQLVERCKASSFKNCD